MNYLEAKEKYKGFNIKAPAEDGIHSKGYYSIGKTQYIYRSEITGRFKNSKNAYLIEGEVLLLPDPLKKKLQMHIAKEITEVPSGIDYDAKTERYNLPVSYLQAIKDEKAVETPEQIKEEVPQSNSFYDTSEGTFAAPVYLSNFSNPTLNKAAQYLAKYKVEESAPFFTSFLTATDLKQDIIGLTEDLNESDVQLANDESIEKIISLLVLYDIYRKRNSQLL